VGSVAGRPVAATEECGPAGSIVNPQPDTSSSQFTVKVAALLAVPPGVVT
jgi:hypothetical protein